MSRITKALLKAEQERTEQKEHLRQSDLFRRHTRIEEGVMKNSWLIWVFVIGVIATVFVAFNYEGGQRSLPLSEIFPEEETQPVDIEYEFVEQPVKEEPTAAVVVTQTAKAEKATPSVNTAIAAQPVMPEAVKAVEKKVEALASKPEKPVSIDPSKAYTIQIASFQKQSMADNLKKELEGNNYAAYVASRDLGSKGTWYRVYVGQYESKTQAETALNDIKKSYSNSFVISPKQ